MLQPPKTNIPTRPQPATADVMSGLARKPRQMAPSGRHAVQPSMDAPIRAGMPESAYSCAFQDASVQPIDSASFRAGWRRAQVLHRPARVHTQSLGRRQWPVRVAQHFATEKHDVGLTGTYDVVGLLG